MVSVLFVRPDSIYKKMNLDCYDIQRDARSFTGLNSVVCHPPCRAWGQLSHFAKPRHDEKELAIWSINLIRKNGGVLEHPRNSKLWKVLNLPLGKQTDQFGGFTISVNQSWWGHKAEKKTLLYIVGCERNNLPDIPLNFNLVEFWVMNGRRRAKDYNYMKVITKKEREATPPDFAKWLIDLAEKCNK